MFLEPQDEIIGLPIAEKAIAVSDLILSIAQLSTSDYEKLKLFFSTGFDCQVKQQGKDLQKGKLKLKVEFIPEKTIIHSSFVAQTPKGKGDKIAGWADTIRLASRTYESGKRDLAFKFLKKVSEQIHTDDERKRLDNLVINEIKDKGIWVHYHSLIFQGGSTAIKV
jgi:hypothetical protein